MKLIVFPPLDDTRLTRIRQAAAPMQVVSPSDEQQALAEIRDADAFFGKLTPPLLAAAQQLRWVQAPTASLEHYLFPELIAHPSKLTNMRGLYSDVVAEHAIGMLIALCRNFPQYVRQQQHDHWAPVGGEEARGDFISGPGTVTAIDRAHRHLAGSTLGIVGLGEIGREIARKAVAFDLRLVAVDPHTDQKVPGVEMIWPPAELDELLTASDFVIIAAPHTPQTAGLFGRTQFERMMRTAYLINVGRGAIVNLSDLAAALAAGDIAGAGLDVFETEPLPAEHPLWRMDNVILTPHIAGYGTQIAGRHLQVVLDNVARFVRGETLLNEVDKARWY
ncbi:MAG: D-2-hydroxyacid dehydrogenase [Pirellulales bacterium]|nr:D-2-hydroxyacid dehydrogenase [Pirellulales bacterium]